MRLTYGELFAGYGGLGMGVQSVLGGDMAWCAEYEAAPSAILAHHWPDVPNLGDVTKIDWTTVPKVDVITGGSPCQDLSHAGKRAGMKAGTRSGLWASMCDAIEIIRPRLVVWENVRGALSAEADSAMEPCPGCVGGADDGPVLRALGRVLGDLAELGYDARWYGLRAADVGAPHGRFRIFVFATDSTRDQGWFSNRNRESTSDADDHRRRQQLAGRPGAERARAQVSSLAASDAASDGRDEGRAEPARIIGGPDAAEHGDATPDAGRERHGRGEDGRALGRVDGDDAGQARERERSREVAGDRSAEVVADADDTADDGERACQESRLGDSPTANALSGGRDGRTPDQIGGQVERAATTGRGEVDWGQYAPAIARWEAVLGRPAPAPTEPGPKGGHRLSPVFVEWLMGLPRGHVTDVPISRNDQLKALGNGVVPQQSAEATRRFVLDAMEAAA